jgi:hypothetical protein
VPSIHIFQTTLAPAAVAAAVIAVVQLLARSLPPSRLQVAAVAATYRAFQSETLGEPSNNGYR